MTEIILDETPRGNSEAEPDALVIHGPSWTRRMAWDDHSRSLLDMLIGYGWQIRHRLGAIEATTPWRPEVLQ